MIGFMMRELIEAEAPIVLAPSGGPSPRPACLPSRPVRLPTYAHPSRPRFNRCGLVGLLNWGVQPLLWIQLVQSSVLVLVVRLLLGAALG